MYVSAYKYNQVQVDTYALGLYFQSRTLSYLPLKLKSLKGDVLKVLLRNPH